METSNIIFFGKSLRRSQLPNYSPSSNSDKILINKVPVEVVIELNLRTTGSLKEGFRFTEQLITLRSVKQLDSIVWFFLSKKLINKTLIVSTMWISGCYHYRKKFFLIKRKYIANNFKAVFEKLWSLAFWKLCKSRINKFRILIENVVA